MKKLITLVLAVMLVACVGMTAFAADVATPFEDETLGIKVVQDFTDTSSITSAFLGTPNAAGSLADAVASGSYAVDNNFTVVNGNQSWVGIIDSAFAGAESAEGFGFYVKNPTGADAELSFYIVADTTGNLNGAAFTIGSDKDYALITADGKTVVTAPVAYHPWAETPTIVQSSFVIPADFEGYVCIPYANLQQNWATNMYNGEALVGFGIMGGVGFVFDNIFVYGANVNGNVEAADLLNELPSNEADISVIAYAAAAIAGLGALAIAKKR